MVTQPLLRKTTSQYMLVHLAKSGTGTINKPLGFTQTPPLVIEATVPVGSGKQGQEAVTDTHPV